MLTDDLHTRLHAAGWSLGEYSLTTAFGSVCCVVEGRNEEKRLELQGPAE